MRRSAFIVAVMLGSGRMAFGCASDAGAPPAAAAVDAGAEAGVIVDATPDQPSPDANDPDPVPPPGLPAGWVISRAYSKHCGVYVPTTQAFLPPPIRWEACPASATPAGADCRLMAIEGDPANPNAPAGAEAAWVRADGSVALGAYRSVKPDWAYIMIAEADGPVRTAFLETDIHLCSLGRATGYGEHYTLNVYEHGSFIGGGMVAGELGDREPRLAIHLTPGDDHSAHAGALTIIDLTVGYSLDPYAWADGGRRPSIWSSAKDDGLQQGPPAFTDDAIFWSSSNLVYQKTKVYTPDAGVRDFLTAGMTTTRGYDELGTDGKDLVWIEAQGRATATGPYDTLTIMTAPYTTEPTQLVARRLRTEDGPFGDSRFVVGCGYGARSTGTHTRIVRLADGVSWTLSNALADPWGWSEPLAITCTELFEIVNVSGVVRLARVRLDSLGPGIAPD